MKEAAILTWLHDSAFGQAARDIAWVFPALETLHFVGLCLLLGSLLLIDLRLLGVTRQMPIAPVTNYINVSLVGFTLCAITGVGFVCADPFNYSSNWAFILKMALIAVAGVNALVFEFLGKRDAIALAPGTQTNALSRCVAGLSLALWFTVLCLGRLLPYLGGKGG